MEQGISRRHFLKTASAGALLSYFGAVTACNITDANNDDPGLGNGNGDTAQGIVIEEDRVILNLDADELAGLRSEGGWLLIQQARLLVVNTDGDHIRALTSVCTHAGCDNSWQYTNERFVCTCHNSVFTNSGQVVSGPALSPLRNYDTEREENIVTIFLTNSLL